MSLTPRTDILCIQSHLCLLLSAIILMSALMLGNTGRTYQVWTWETSGYNIKNIALFTVVFSFIFVTSATLHFHYLSKTSEPLFFIVPLLHIPCVFTDLSSLFLLLVSTLMPAVIILADLDHHPRQLKFFVTLLTIYLVTSLLILTTDLLIFYILYELLVMLVFFSMYTSTNARGCIEASLFFLGWAAIGSVLVGLAVVYFITIGGTTNFYQLRQYVLTNDEVFSLYMLSFFGFGTKLSLWPFWYWLPRAHVEVSTSMSIFLSCILLKVCLYCLMRFWWIINSEVVISPFIFFVALCTFDVTCRLIVQVDLKAIIAYGSVLHINLLVLLVLLDTYNLTAGVVFYIWGHSLATAGLFYAVSLIERCYGTRATFEISGLYNTNPLIGIITMFAVIGCLDFPLSVFFWGELWLWITIFSTIPLTAAILMFVSSVIYVIVFFRIWWGLIFGASSHAARYPITTVTWNDLYMTIYLVLSQYILGLQPNILFLFTLS